MIDSQWHTWIDSYIAATGPLGQIVIAAALGAIVGIEREYRGKAAGIRTNMLITIGACLIMILSEKVAGLDPVTGKPLWDPGRMAAQVVSGIGFLGAGTIIHSRHFIKGLTTAAMMWLLAAVGLAVGAHYFVIAAGTVFIIIVGLSLLNPVERFFSTIRVRTCQVDLELNMASLAFQKIETLLGEHRMKEHGFQIQIKGDVIHTNFAYSGRPSEIKELQEQLLSLKGVNKLNIEIEG